MLLARLAAGAVIISMIELPFYVCSLCGAFVLCSFDGHKVSHIKGDINDAAPLTYGELITPLVEWTTCDRKLASRQ